MLDELGWCFRDEANIANPIFLNPFCDSRIIRIAKTKIKAY